MPKSPRTPKRPRARRGPSQKSQKSRSRAKAAPRRASTRPRDLRSLLAVLKVSQRKFSTLLGVDESYVSHVLRGSKQPSFKLASRMADALGLDLGVFKTMLERSAADERRA